MTSVGQPKEFRRLTLFCFMRKIWGMCVIRSENLIYGHPMSDE